MKFGLERKIFHVDDAQCVFGRFEATPLKISVIGCTNNSVSSAANQIKEHFVKYKCEVKGPIDESKKRLGSFRKVIILENYDAAAIKGAMSLTISKNISIEIHSCEQL